jgi:adenosylmethionine-8-amino-7-oxononanoate aminotransferase
VWIRPFGDIVYTTPTYTITPAELTRLTAAMLSVVASV